MGTFRTAALVTVFLATAPPASAGPLGPFSDLLVFGDSLSDPGNAFAATGGTIPDPLLYPNGQFTDGDTWATQLGAALASGTNFAFGGANAVTNADISPDFAAQRALYSLVSPVSPSLGPRPLTAVFLGGNDLRVASSAAEGASIIAAATSAIAGGVEELIDGGLDDFLIIGLPNLGRLPDVVDSPAAGLARSLTVAYNAALQAAIAPLEARASLQYFEVFEAIFADPSAYGIANTTDACLDSFPVCGPGTAGGHVFYDNLHPTGTVHAAYAQGIAARLAPVPLPASLPLAGAGLFLLLAAGPRSGRSGASRNRARTSQTVWTRGDWPA